jgi:integrase
VTVKVKKRHNDTEIESENGAAPKGKLKAKEYDAELSRLHVELVKLQEWVKYKGLKVCVVFEGRDGAGKGGTIKAITERVSPRVFRVVALPAPSEREKSQMYLQRYVRHLRTTKGELAAKDAARRFKNYVLNDRSFAVAELAKLNPARLDAWRTALHEMPTRSGPRRGERRTDSTLNRDMACFRAALNLAYDEGLVTSDFAWRSKLRPVKNADRRRETYLDRTQRRSFIEKAAPDVADFLYGLALLPLRPGALAALRVGDYDRRLQVLKVGQDKSGRDRKIKLPVATATFLDEASKNKLPGAPLLSRGDGKVWDRHAWKLPVKAAAVAADLPPGTSAYTMRHSVISDLVHDGLDLLTVAQISGTSVAMIERHYGHLRGEIAAEALARLAL